MSVLKHIQPKAGDNLASLGITKMSSAFWGTGYSVHDADKFNINLNTNFGHDSEGAIVVDMFHTADIATGKLFGWYIDFPIPSTSGKVLDIDLMWNMEYEPQNNHIPYYYFALESNPNGTAYSTLLYYDTVNHAFYRRTSYPSPSTSETYWSPLFLETFTHPHYFRIRVTNIDNVPVLRNICWGGEKQNPSTATGWATAGSVASGFFRIYMAGATSSYVANKHARFYVTNIRQWEDRTDNCDYFNQGR